MLNLKCIELEIRATDKLATIWLNRPESRNSLNPQILNDLVKSIRWLEGQEDIRVVLLRGKGNSFCSGADINWMRDSGLLSYRKNLRESKRLATCFHTLYQSDKVIINLLHGHAIGGALGFIGAGDFSFALKDTSFGLPELRLGLFASVITPYLLTRVRQNALKYKLFTGKSFSAEEALTMGLIDGIFTSLKEMEAETDEFIHSIASASPGALTEGKKLLRHVQRAIVNRRTINETVRTITRLKMSEDARNRMSKFILQNTQRKET